MAVTNYTPLDDLMAKIKKSYTPFPSKEVEPVSSHEEEEKEIKFVVEHKDLDKEVQPHIQVHEEVMEIPPDLREMGVHPTPTSRVQTYQQVKSLIPDDQIIKGLEQPVGSSFRWLAELALYILKHAHIILKKVHGKVIRVENN